MEFIKGMDISMVDELERNGARYYLNGTPGDLFSILSECGTNTIRLRLWQDPYDKYGNPYGGGGNDFETTINLAKRTIENKMDFLLDFHYSDFWADPAKQIKPKAWSGLNSDELETAVYLYTLQTLKALRNQKLIPSMIQIGNEITNGLLWPEGHIDNIQMMTRLLKAGIKGAREECPEAKIVLHLDFGTDNQMYRNWFEGVSAYTLDYDIIGMSYYPHFNGSIASLIDNMNDVSDTFNKDVMIAETSIGYTLETYGCKGIKTLNPDTRRSGGMHYTSIENIHKVIDPLFLDGLKKEFEEIKDITVEKTRKAKLSAYQEKLASLKFLDPACGSGNFLTETYLSIRRLENDVIYELTGGQMTLGDVASPIKVSIQQFYGIEINDFAVTVAKTALWIAESQMMKETECIVHMVLDFLPLKTNAYIIEGNALRIDWESVVPKSELNYIMGNPPFVGARLMSAKQKDDVISIFGKDWKNVGNLDYVTCWYKKAAEIMQGTPIRAALVSTNSVSQGETVSNLWKPLFEMGCHIDFAHRTFRWDSEAKIKAHVHCVIIGFSIAPNNNPKFIYNLERKQEAKNINAYLIDADNIFVESRGTPICDVPDIGIGNKPIDGGNYLFAEEDMNDFIKAEPASKKYFKPWYGSQEFISRKPRYCLWLGECSPAELRQMPLCMKRIEAVRDFRLQSTSAGTVKLAERPTHFHVENMPKSTYIVIPEVSSERRRYIPMGFMTPDILCSNLVKLIPDASLYHFGILTSNVHMAWVRVVCGRLKSDYRYSKDVVYNNFPWPEPNDEQRAKIEKTAQMILDAREKYPDSSLADLYDDLTMPPELRKAHNENDKAVLAAYGWVKGTPEFGTESACVAALMRMYQGKVSGK